MSKQPQTSSLQSQPAGDRDGPLLLPDGRGRRILAPQRHGSVGRQLDMPRIVAHYELEAVAMRRRLLADVARAAAKAMQRVVSSLHTEPRTARS